MSGPVTQERLQKWVDPDGKVGPDYVLSWVRRNKIPYFTGKHGTICTTEEAINLALFGDSRQDAGISAVDFADGPED